MSVDVTSYTGDSLQLQIAITDAAGASVDVSGASSIRYVIVDKAGTALVSKTLGSGISVEEHIVTVTVDPDDTAFLAAGLYIHELEVVTADDAVHTVYHGTMELLADVIKAA